MTSSPGFQLSSSFLSSSGTHRNKSKFVFKHLAQLGAASTNSPLRVVAHVDLDCFYAQCEMIRLDVAEDQSLAVRQWQGLIAINYPARKFGLNRMITSTEARKLCPDLIMQHVATWKEGEETWAYHEDAAKNIATHKVSLDPYRLESRKILACIKKSLPENLQKVEKAGIDEVFLDLSAQIHSELLQRYPELADKSSKDDLTEFLPLPPTTALDWQADALVDLDTGETEEDDPDWDDVAILIGSEIVRDLRRTIREELKYTCSAGIARNKMLAKLGSAHKKPNQQTIIRNRAVQQFLSDFKFTKIRGLGGKLGEQVSSTFSTDIVKDLLPVTVEQLKQKLGDDTGTWVYQVIRGTDSSEVSTRTQIKSMLSAKSFRPNINTPEQATRWLRIFVADIYSRLVEEGVIENKRRPKTINLHYRQGSQTKSRQAPIPLGKKLDEPALFELAQSLLGQIISEGSVWPCSNLSLSVGGFEDGIVGNMGIGAFLIKGAEAKGVSPIVRESHPSTESNMSEFGHNRLGKRRRLDPSTGIQRFFNKPDNTDDHDDEFGAQHLPGMDAVSAEGEVADMKKELDKAAASTPHENKATRTIGKSTVSASVSALHQKPITDFICNRCNEVLESADVLQSHQDWHMARDLQDEEKERSAQRSRPLTSKPSSMPSTNINRKKPTRSQPEKGQTKLTFD